MKTFKSLRKNLLELKMAFKVPKGETLITSFDIGKKPNTKDAHVTKKGSLFNVYVDGDKLDTYSSEKDAVKSAKEFGKLIGK